MRISGFIAVVLLCMGASVSHGEDELPCPRIAIARGEPSLVGELNTRLQDAGVGTQAIVGCPMLTVNVELQDRSIHLAIVDSASRETNREASNIATAATIVESWTYQAIDLGHTFKPSENKALTNTPNDKPDAVGKDLNKVVAARAAEAEATNAVNAELAPVAVGLLTTTRYRGFSLGADSARGDSGKLWFGAAAHGCVSLGPVCLGATLRALKAKNETTQDSSINVMTVDFLGTLALRLDRGNRAVEVGIVVGPSWVQRDTISGPADHAQAEATNDLALRTGLFVAASYSWIQYSWGRLSLRSELAGDINLLTTVVHTDDFFARLNLGLRLETQ